LISRAAFEETPVGGVVHIKGIAHGIRAFKAKWELDVIFKRTD
jgi:hypothetical protein